MKVWIHRKSGKLMITWQAYAIWSEVRDTVKLEAPIYAGEACENENGITCLFSQGIYEEFDYIGDL